MKLRFSKMHGLGNDFMVIDGINQTLPRSTAWIKRLSCRHKGLGFDQCLIVEPSKKSAIDFVYRIFNADGTEVGQCGNGARCLAVFIKQQGLSIKNLITVSTQDTEMELRLNDDASVTVHMSDPQFTPNDIPLLFDSEADDYPFSVDDKALKLHALSVGNPHGIVCVDDLSASNFETLAPKLEQHPLFPQHANISFMQIIDKAHIALRVYERGSGETLACGSAATAAACAAMRFHHCEPTVNVSLPGGKLTVHWQGPGSQLSLTGPATHVFDGVIEL